MAHLFTVDNLEIYSSKTLSLCIVLLSPDTLS